MIVQDVLWTEELSSQGAIPCMLYSFIGAKVWGPTRCRFFSVYTDTNENITWTVVQTNKNIAIRKKAVHFQQAKTNLDKIRLVMDDFYNISYLSFVC